MCSCLLLICACCNCNPASSRPTACVCVAPCGYAPHAATRQSAGYCVSTPAERPGKGDEGWWVGLGTIPAFSRDERTPFDGINLKPHKLLENAHAVPTGSSPITCSGVLCRGSGAYLSRCSFGTRCWAAWAKLVVIPLDQRSFLGWQTTYQKMGRELLRSPYAVVEHGRIDIGSTDLVWVGFQPVPDILDPQDCQSRFIGKAPCQVLQVAELITWCVGQPYRYIDLPALVRRGHVP